jgi:hypothetical protein
MFARFVRAAHFPDREAEKEARSQNIKLGEYLIANALCDAISISEQDVLFLFSSVFWKMAKGFDIDDTDLYSVQEYVLTLPRCLPKATIIKEPPGLTKTPEVQVKPDALALSPPVSKEAHKAYESATRTGLGEREWILRDLLNQIKIWEERHIVLESEGVIPLIEVVCKDQEKTVTGYFLWKGKIRTMTLKAIGGKTTVWLHNGPRTLHLLKEGKVFSVNPNGFGAKQENTCDWTKSRKPKPGTCRESSRYKGFFFERGLFSRQVATNRI